MTETFPIVPAQLRLLGVGVPLLLILLGVFALLGATIYGSRASRFEVSREGLRLRGDLYGRLVPASALRLGEARAVDLTAERALAPKLRTMGTAIPGYRAGWFRLRNGEKALLYVSDMSRVAYVPTTEGYSVMVSVADPERFVASLRREAGTRQ